MDSINASSTSVRVKLETQAGQLVIEVYPQLAPASAAAFLALVDNSRTQMGRFWRVVRTDNDPTIPHVNVIQARCEGTSHPVVHESTEQTTILHVDGVVSLARDDVGTATGADFFICLGDQPALDYGGTRKPDGQGFAAFGRVVAGMDVVRHVHGMRTTSDADSPFPAGQLLAEEIGIVSARRDTSHPERRAPAVLDRGGSTESPSPQRDRGIPPASAEEPRAGRAAWFALSVLVMLTLLAFVDRLMISLVAAPMAKDLALTDSQLGVIQGLVFAVFGLVATYPIGWLGDRLDRRLVLGACLVVWGLGTASFGLVHSYPGLLAAALAMAAGEAGLVPLVYGVIPALFKGRQRIVANQIFYVASIIGSAVGLILGGAAVAAIESLHGQLPASLAHLAPWRVVFLAVAAPAPLLLGLIALTNLGNRGRAPGAPALAPDEGRAGPYFRRYGKVVALVFASFCIWGLPYGGLLAFTPVALTRLFNTSSAETGAGLGLSLGIGCIVGVGLGAWLLRRVLPRLGAAAPLRLCTYSQLVMLPTVVLLPFITNATQAFVLIGVMMAGGTLVGSLLPTVIQGIAPGALRGRVAAVYSIIDGTARGVGTFAVGPLSDALPGNQRGLLIAVAVLSVLSWLTASILFRVAERPYARTLQSLEEAGSQT